MSKGIDNDWNDNQRKSTQQIGMRSPSSNLAQRTRILLLDAANKFKITETIKKKNDRDREKGTRSTLPLLLVLA